MSYFRPASFLAAPFRIGVGLALCCVGISSSIELQAVADEGVGLPRVVVLPAQSEIFVGGDCNNASVWVKDQLRIYASPYPIYDFPGGAAWYSYGPTVQNLQGTAGVNPD